MTNSTTQTDTVDRLVEDIPLGDQFDGLNVFAVGGVVRAAFTGNPVTDVDLMVQGATPSKMEERGFEFIDATSFPVFLDEHKREVALARTEQSNGDGHTDFDVVASPDVTVEEDLSRRDFTVNAMAVNLTTGELVDPFGGVEDIENEVIRTVSDDSFSDDPLRTLRMARFAARLDFDVEPDTLHDARQHVDGLHHLPNERWGMEVVKAMKQAQTPSRFFQVLDDADALPVVFPELTALQDVPAGPREHHGEGSAFDHTMLVLDEMGERRPGEPRALLAAVAHDLGKALTDEERLPSHPKHHVKGQDVVPAVQERLVLSNELAGVMQSASRFHMRFHKLAELRESTLLETVDRLRVTDPDNTQPSHMTLGEAVDLTVADARGRVPSSEPDTDDMWALLRQAETVLDEIDGQHVLDNFEPNNGEHVGELLLQERIRALRNPDEFGLELAV